MSEANGRENLRLLVLVLLAAQVVAVVFAWLLNPLGAKSQTEFTMLLAVNLVAFALLSYIGRASWSGGAPRGAYVIAGSAVVLIFMFLVLLA